MIDTGALGTGLVVTEFTIGSEVAVEFGRWHSDEHIGERLAIEGMRSARRYVSTMEPLRFLALYRGVNSGVYQTAPYRALADNVSEATRRVLATLSGIRLVGDIVRETGGGYGSATCRIRITCAPSEDPAVPAWFDAEAGRLLGEPGVVRLTLVEPRRELPGVSDPSWIALIEGYNEAVLDRIAADYLRTPVGFVALAAEVFRLEHLVI